MKILLVEDNPGDARLIKAYLEELQEEYEIEFAETLEQAIDHMGRFHTDILLLDLGLPDSQGLDTLRSVLAAGPKYPILVLTGLDNEETGLAAVMEGAQDYLLKGQIGAQALHRSFRYAVERYKIGDELQKTIVQLRDTQKQLLRSEKLAALGHLSAGIAHEIKNPLNIISLRTQLARMNNRMSQENIETFDIIDEQVRRAVKITDNLRDFACERKSEVRPIALQELLEQTIELVEYELRVENITVLRQFGEKPITIAGDQDQLAQVFLNLIDNARYAMNDKQRTNSGEELQAEAWEGRLTITLTPVKSTIVIDFQDTGPGIPADVIQRVFDPFFTTKAEGEGTGLGLSTAYGIVENHGGRMEIESPPGSGALVRVILPVGDAGDQTPTA